MADEPKASVGRPIYTDELADKICERLALGESLRSICDDKSMPAQSTVFRWLASKDYLPFREQYERAREVQADALFDDILGIADDGRNDWMLRKFGDEERLVENGEAIRRSQLRIDARKWMAGKLRPKKYGDKVTNVHEGGDKPIEVTRIERVIVRSPNSDG